MEEILKQLLEGQNKLFQEISNLDSKVSNLDSKVSSLDSKVSNLDSKVSSLSKEVSGLNKDVSNLKSGQQQLITRIDQLTVQTATIKEDMATKIQQDENTQFIKAINHNIETTNAELNALHLNTLNKEVLANLATKEDIIDTNDHLKALNERLFHQEAKLSHLKAVK